ncbi:hypothetical protein [Paenibacillus tianmuensis]|uniref:hypothetical protein n=1 Tax=Paenibacillus tianmuensis TaxID=624147 RepID=UPI00115FA438|nr:hypothetical protein [Paenibacillus tianmuensis]
MNIIPGQGLWLKGRFANGTQCDYNRPFLVIENTGTIIKALNVSSLRGKETKLIIPSNKNLSKHFPPFPQPSFVKLDEIYHYESFSELEQSVMSSGKCLDTGLLSQVISWHSLYSSENRTWTVDMKRSELILLNPIFATT